LLKLYLIPFGINMTQNLWQRQILPKTSFGTLLWKSNISQN